MSAVTAGGQGREEFARSLTAMLDAAAALDFPAVRRHRKVLKERHRAFLDEFVRHTTDAIPHEPPQNTVREQLLTSLFLPYALAVIDEKAYYAAKRLHLRDYDSIAGTVMESLLKRFKKPKGRLDLSTADKFDAYVYIAAYHEAVDQKKRVFVQLKDGAIERARFSAFDLNRESLPPDVMAMFNEELKAKEAIKLKRAEQTARKGKKKKSQDGGKV